MLEKERLEIKGKPGKFSLERKPELRIPKEISGWLEKLEKGDVYLAKPVVDDQTGQVLVTAPSAKKAKIVLPLDKQKLIYGLTQKTSEAIRWLAEWCLRLIKMKPAKLMLKTNEPVN